jgi:hypothetical protein
MDLEHNSPFSSGWSATDTPFYWKSVEGGERLGPLFLLGNSAASDFSGPRNQIEIIERKIEDFCFQFSPEVIGRAS